MEQGVERDDGVERRVVKRLALMSPWMNLADGTRSRAARSGDARCPADDIRRPTQRQRHRHTCSAADVEDAGWSRQALDQRGQLGLDGYPVPRHTRCRLVVAVADGAGVAHATAAFLSAADLFVRRLRRDRSAAAKRPASDWTTSAWMSYWPLLTGMYRRVGISETGEPT